jgi:hypothetical protein
MPISQEEWDTKLKEIYPEFIAMIMKESDCDAVKTLKQLSSILKKDFKIDEAHDTLEINGKVIKRGLSAATKIKLELRVAELKRKAIETFVDVFIKPLIPKEFNLKHTGFENLADRLAEALSGDGTGKD